MASGIMRPVAGLLALGSPGMTPDNDHIQALRCHATSHKLDLRRRLVIMLTSQPQCSRQRVEDMGTNLRAAHVIFEEARLSAALECYDEARQGDWSCGPVPFGYRKEDGKLIDVAERADVVRRIFALYLELRTLRGVARLMNEDGIPSPRGKLWSMQQVK